MTQNIVSVDKAPSPCQRSHPNPEAAGGKFRRSDPKKHSWGRTAPNSPESDNRHLELLPHLQRDTIEMVERYQIIDGVAHIAPIRSDGRGI